jgi:hypothetical protein
LIKFFGHRHAKVRHPDKCQDCLRCQRVCEHNAISIRFSASGLRVSQDEIGQSPTCDTQPRIGGISCHHTRESHQVAAPWTTSDTSYQNSRRRWLAEIHGNHSRLCFLSPQYENRFN